MNKLKIELRTMNKETRKKVMMDLQHSFAKNSTGRQISHNRSGITKSTQPSMQGQQQAVPMQQHHTPTPMRNSPVQTPMRTTPPPRQGQPGGHR